ncbi:MAG: TonB-dependent receptor [Betaproteobacteria bacterium]|jgi:iron complex outermembrane receptor protein
MSASESARGAVVCGFALSLCLSFAGAAAQNTNTEGNQASRLTEIVVKDSTENDTVGLERKTTSGSRLGLTVKETPASVYVIDSEQMERRGIATTQEALWLAPGITTSSAPGSAGQVFYRGFNATSLTQMFNGITVQYDAIAARPVDSWIYDRVEVVGGPSSYLFGSGAVGGSINYITKLASRQGDFTDFKAGYGRFDDSQLAAGINRRLGEANVVRIDVNRSAMQGWSDGTRRESWQVAGSWLWDIKPGLSHTLAIEYQNEQVDRPYWGTPLLRPVAGQIAIDPATRFKNYNSIDGLYEQTVVWARSITEYRVNDQLRLTNTFYHYDALRDYMNVEVYAFNAANTLVTRSAALLQRHDQRLNGNRIEFNLDSSLAGLKTAWAGGVDYSINEQTRFPLSLAGPFGNVNPYNFTTELFYTLPGMSLVYNPDRTNRLKTLAFYLENRTQLNRQWSVITGIRQDVIDLEVTNFRAVTAANPAYFERTYRPLTGRLGVVYDWTPTASLYAQYSTAADPPAGILTTATFGQVQNFDLTTGRQAEVGSKFSFDQGKGAATIAFYDIVRKNLAVTNPNVPGTTIPVGQQSSRGVELSASYRLTPRLTLSGNSSFVDARYDQFFETVGPTTFSRAGNRPTNIPKQVHNLQASYRPVAQVEMGVDMRHVSDRFADNANTVFDGAYTLWGAFATYKIDRKTKITARAKNLTDKVYAENLGGTNLVYLGAPRTFNVAVQTSF